MICGFKYSAVFLSSALLVGLQIVLMQVMAQIQGHHFAYIIIALALLGFGCSGTVLALARGFLMRHLAKALPLSLLLAAFSVLAFLPVCFTFAAKTDFQLLFAEWQAWWPMLISASSAFLPFFFGAIFLGLVFVSDTQNIGKLYAANLTGSACGAALAIAALHMLHPENILPLCAALFSVAAFFAGPRGTGSISMLCAVLFVAGLKLGYFSQPHTLSPYKPVSYALQLPKAEITVDRPHPMGRIQIVTAPALRTGAGISLQHGGDIPAAPHMFRSGEGYGAFPADAEIFKNSLHALPAAFPDSVPRRVLILHASGSLAIPLLLKESGIEQLDAVEPHPVAAELTQNFFGDTRLNVIPRDGRAFLGQTGSQYDLILLPQQGAFGGGTGLQALQEDYLITRESFHAIWDRLSDDGILFFPVYLDRPPRRILKLLALTADILRESGINDPAAHIAALRSWDMIGVAVFKNPPDGNVQERLAAFARSNGFDRLWIPGEGPSKSDGFHLTQDSLLEDGFAALLGTEEDSRAFQENYLFRITPPTDSRPYFHQFIRWDKLAEINAVFGSGNIAFVEMGAVLVGITALLLAAASFILIVTPLFALGWPRGGRLGVFLYFSGIGLGFMFLEIALIQQFTLFWGHPLYSAAGVIAALLCGMGIGSFFTARLPDCPKILIAAPVAAAGLALLLPLALPVFMSSALSWPEFWKWTGGIILLLLPATALGTVFPLMLRRLDNTLPHQVPWAWGINGCFSVLAAPLAVLIAMQGGFPVVGLAAALCYFVAVAAAGFFMLRSLPKA